MEKAEDRQVDMRMGRGVEMACGQELRITTVYRVQVFCILVTQSTLGLANVEATSGAPNAVGKGGGMHVKLCLTYKGCLGPWMVVRERVQEQVLHTLGSQGKCQEAARNGW